MTWCDIWACDFPMSRRKLKVLRGFKRCCCFTRKCTFAVWKFSKVLGNVDVTKLSSRSFDTTPPCITPEADHVGGENKDPAIALVRSYSGNIKLSRLGLWFSWHGVVQLIIHIQRQFNKKISTLSLLTSLNHAAVLGKGLNVLYFTEHCLCPLARCWKASILSLCRFLQSCTSAGYGFCSSMPQLLVLRYQKATQ